MGQVEAHRGETELIPGREGGAGSMRTMRTRIGSSLGDEEVTVVMMTMREMETVDFGAVDVLPAKVAAAGLRNVMTKNNEQCSSHCH